MGDVTVEAITKSYPSASSNIVTFKIPSALYSDADDLANGRLVVGMKFVPTNGCGSSCGVKIQQVRAWAGCSPDVACSDSLEASSDTDGLTNGWGGVVQSEVNGQTVIGKYGAAETSSEITYGLGKSVTAEYVEVELDVEWSGSIDFKVKVDSNLVTLELSTSSDSTLGSKSGTLIAWFEGGKVFVRVPSTEFNTYGFAIPYSYYSDGSRFWITGYKIRSVCSTKQGARKLDNEQDGRSVASPVSEPQGDGEEYSFYCLAKDFPCEGGPDFVHVCHYSSRVGYQTFCIPEADSEVLRFYSRDYCGPCIGGFA